jgi:hypothetical protein
MNPERWHIRSLRRFEDSEIALSIYLSLGGVCSLFYAAGAVWHTQIYKYIFSDKMVTGYSVIGRIVLHIAAHAILRVVTWAPDMISQVLLGHQSILDWLFAVNILKDLS